MPVIVNPLQGADPTAQAFANVGNALFGNTGEAELRKQQIIDAQRKNIETMNLGARIKALGAQNAGDDPTVQAEAIESGYDPANLGKLGLMGSAFAKGATAPQTQNWQVGTGQSYDNTADAVNAKLAETAREFNQKPLPAVNANGDPAFATQGNTDGYTPLVSDADEKGALIAKNWNNLDTLNPNQQAVVGAARAPGAPQTPKNYVAPDGTTTITYDGISDARTGQQLPPGGFIANAQGPAKDVGLGTNTVKTNLETALAANTNFITQANGMVALAKAHPEAFGPVGTVRGLGQEAMQTGSTLLNLVGGDGAFQQAQAAAKNAGLGKMLPEMYDPNIPKARAAYYVLLYNYSSALAGQQGRSVSDQDIKLAEQALGNPDDLFGSSQNFITKVQTAATIAAQNAEHARFLLKNGVTATDPNDANYSANLENVGSDQKNIPNTAAPVTSATPPAGGQAAPPAAGETPLQPKTAADFAAMPSGTLYVDPGDNKQYRKP